MYRHVFLAPHTEGRRFPVQREGVRSDLSLNRAKKPRSKRGDRHTENFAKRRTPQAPHPIEIRTAQILVLPDTPMITPTGNLLMPCAMRAATSAR